MLCLNRHCGSSKKQEEHRRRVFHPLKMKNGLHLAQCDWIKAAGQKSLQSATASTSCAPCHTSCLKSTTRGSLPSLSLSRSLSPSICLSGRLNKPAEKLPVNEAATLLFTERQLIQHVKMGGETTVSLHTSRGLSRNRNLM